MPSKAMSTWTDYLDISVIKNHILAVLTSINKAFSYMQQTYFHLIMSLHLLSFPKHSKTDLKSLYF